MRFIERPLSRRRFLTATAATGLLGATGSLAMPGVSRAADRPQVTAGLQSGDVAGDRAVLWSRTDRPANAIYRMVDHREFQDREPAAGR